MKLERNLFLNKIDVSPFLGFSIFLVEFFYFFYDIVKWRKISRGENDKTQNEVQ